MSDLAFFLWVLAYALGLGASPLIYFYLKVGWEKLQGWRWRRKYQRRG